MATEYESYLRRYLNDNGVIWTSAQLETWAREAEEALAKKVPTIVDRVALNIQNGVPLYALPDYVIGVRRITWLGYKIYPITKSEARVLYPNSALSSQLFGVFSSAFSPTIFNVFGSNSGESKGRPLHWSYSGYSWNKIQFYPTPDINVAAPTSGLWDAAIRSSCIVEYYRLPNFATSTNRIPAFMRRVMIKDFVLAKAFMVESIGQDLQAAKWHQNRFDANLEIFKSICSGVFVAKQQRLGLKDSLTNNMRGRAVLPPQFGVNSWR